MATGKKETRVPIDFSDFKLTHFTCRRVKRTTNASRFFGFGFFLNVEYTIIYLK